MYQDTICDHCGASFATRRDDFDYGHGMYHATHADTDLLKHPMVRNGLMGNDYCEVRIVVAQRKDIDSVEMASWVRDEQCPAVLLALAKNPHIEAAHLTLLAGHEDFTIREALWANHGASLAALCEEFA